MVQYVVRYQYANMKHAIQMYSAVSGVNIEEFSVSIHIDIYRYFF